MVLNLSSWACCLAARALFAGSTNGDRSSSMSTELSELQEELAPIRSAQGEAWLNDRRAEEVKALVRDVLGDAGSRASLAGMGLTAGHDGKKFFLRDGEGISDEYRRSPPDPLRRQFP